MIKLSGFTIGKDMELVFTGLRPGEKLYEEVLSDAETTQPTHHPKILIARVKEYDDSKVAAWLNELTPLLTQQSNDQLVGALKVLIPEYISNNSEFQKLDQHGEKE
jgi:FlaA1/EpsC-like NDP-sugar epimerase